ncbi:hypothetical protein B0I72DRAFT_142970 [Yarrowia lipolytica]|uniref:Uncharacterized protein n=1 Tax=Yarrowia lipolytica TaxID=4952 RepID=A0A371C318_YARLL|nr:hypothetical protein B0I71DRAFT_133947 [Yarrowia lipolytica]RDW29568.1 hypothetical protein B0I72DRAFT_142970 [Yarrowia lipolytica]RDW38858.1 hypothetical protein B0I73DRAFT_133074 [Yarrowia lipolytica]
MFRTLVRMNRHARPKGTSSRPSHGITDSLGTSKAAKVPLSETTLPGGKLPPSLQGKTAEQRQKANRFMGITLILVAGILIVAGYKSQKRIGTKEPHESIETAVLQRVLEANRQEKEREREKKTE